MKRCRIAYLLVLVTELAISSPNAMAQMASAVGLPSADAATIGPSTRPLYSNPILAYVRPTQKEKRRLFEFDAFGPYALAKAALAAGFQQATTTPPEWGSGWDAFGTRVASNFGIQLVTTTTHYGLAEILREDAAYYPCQCSGFFRRFGHALISTVTARHGEDGHTSISFSALVSPYAGTMTALAWYPDRFSVKDAFRAGNYNLAGQAAGNLALEFIYGGPHSLLYHIRRFKSPDGTAAAQTP